MNNKEQMQVQIQNMLGQITSLMQQVNNSPALEQPAPAPPASPEPTHELRTIKTVNGIEEARAAQRKLLSGESMILMDESESIFYAITKDKDGKSPRKIMVGRFTMEEEPEPPKYVTQADLESFKADLLNAIKGGNA